MFAAPSVAGTSGDVAACIECSNALAGLCVSDSQAVVAVTSAAAPIHSQLVLCCRGPLVVLGVLIVGHAPVKAHAVGDDGRGFFVRRRCASDVSAALSACRSKAISSSVYIDQLCHLRPRVISTFLRRVRNSAGRCCR